MSIVGVIGPRSMSAWFGLADMHALGWVPLMATDSICSSRDSASTLASNAS